MFHDRSFCWHRNLCATAKQAGLTSSIAVDKIRKKSSRCTILQLYLCNEHHRSLLERWLQSPMCLWVHIAPVCGTASRARDIRRFPGDPPPLRSNAEPEGLSDLPPESAERVRIAMTFLSIPAKFSVWPAPWAFWPRWRTQRTATSG